MRLCPSFKKGEMVAYSMCIETAEAIKIYNLIVNYE